jgi:SAM-dependent methyltransferase
MFPEWLEALMVPSCVSKMFRVGRRSRPGRECERVSTYLQVLGSLGHELRPDSSILDFGCGRGEAVTNLLDAGFSARGCDLRFPENTSTNVLVESGALAEIREHPYGLPYPDACFDAVISDQVFEHVIDYDSAIDEIYRVLKPGGVTLHIFPSRLSPVEVHTHVPAAGFFAPYWWLSLWAHLGIRRMPSQVDKTAAQSAHHTYSYLRQNTNYHNRNWIRAAFERRFRSVTFCERELLHQSQRGRWVSQLAPAVPLFSVAYSAFWERVVFAEKR